MLARKYRNEIIIALAALAIAAAWLPIRMRFPFDDTYITFRYAANLAHGFGIVWNHGGAHTEGYTNFLFMLMLVPFSAMGCDLVIVSQAIGVVAIVVSAIAIFWIVANGEWRVANDSNSNAPQFSVLRSPFLQRRFFCSIHLSGSMHIRVWRRVCLLCGYCFRLLLCIGDGCRLFLRRLLLSRGRKGR